MKNVTTNPTQTNTDNSGYFDSVMYARVYINSVRVVQVEKGDNYAALSASIINLDDNGQKTYTNIELNAKGEKVNAILREFREDWPKYGDKNRWIADINIGNLEDDFYHSKKHNCNKPSLRGRLIHIRSLNVNGKVVIGEQNELRPAMLVAQAYINEIDMAKKTAKASILDGKVTKPNYRTIQLSFDDISMFKELEEKGLCPRGYNYRQEDATIYSIITIENVMTELYEYDGKDQSTLKGTLTGVRYLKDTTNNEVLTKAKSITEKFVEGFKERYAAA